MNEIDFRMWLFENKNKNTIRTYISRCLRVEEALNISLDDEYKFDGGERVIQMLSYSREDERNHVIPTCGIVFSENADIYGGMHSLRASVKQYFEFIAKFEQQEKE